MTGSEQAQCACDIPRAEQIAQLNDKLRKTGRGGTRALTRGVRALPGFLPSLLLAQLAAYDSFDADNDPHGERDFGDIDIAGTNVLWKIDYYDTALQFGSADPADASVTERVLTVMLPEEC